jgi:hypothetical protein
VLLVSALRTWRRGRPAAGQDGTPGPSSCIGGGEFKGWTVCETLTGPRALINGVPQMSIAIDDADDLADLVNHLQIQQAKATTNRSDQKIFRPLTPWWCLGR